jgi:hypothetical protein
VFLLINGLKQQTEEFIMQKSRLLTFLGIAFLSLSVTGCQRISTQSTGSSCPVIPYYFNDVIVRNNADGSIPLIPVDTGILPPNEQYSIQLSNGYSLALSDKNPKSESSPDLLDCKYKVKLTPIMQARITPVIDIKTFKKLQVFWISKKYLQDFPQEPLSSSQLVVLLVSQTFFVIGVFVVLFLNIKTTQKRSEKRTKELIVQTTNQAFNQLVVQSKHQLEELYRKFKEKIKVVSDQVVELNSRITLSSALMSPQETKIPQPQDSYYPPISVNNYPDSFSSDIPLVTSPLSKAYTSSTKRQIDEVIEQFNDGNNSYFKSDLFYPLKLTQVSINREIGIDYHTIINFEPTDDMFQASYLRIMADSENWLLPNPGSLNFGQIINRLEQNSDIFIIGQGAASLPQRRLIKPAKLRDIGSGLWEVEEPGVFQ